MPEPDPTPGEQLDAICDEFETAWKSGQSPRIEDFLPRMAKTHQGELFAELLKVELHHRNSRGEVIRRRDYLERFPEHRELIEKLIVERPASPLVSPGGVRVRCPHCHQPIELLPDESLKDVTCNSCGSSFNLLTDVETVTQSSQAGQMLGQFELKEPLGTGAFGTVWKARDTILDRLVACKIPRAGDLSESDREKFFREARAAAQLRHENIVSVHEVGRDGDTIYIISDYVDGLTLADWLTGQQPSVREAAEIVRQVALALEHAHQKGVIHRDIKPSNIMLDADFKPHVMDFGLAKREAGEVTMTISGAILGTPAYMSPEQARGDAHQVDARSDVYSLGVVLFELLTGDRPFRGNTRMLLHQVLRDDPPSPRKLNSTIPRDLETICLKCLEKEPEKRYPSALALADDLQRSLSGEPITARPVGRLERLWRWAKRNPTVAGSLSVISLLLLILGIGGPLAAWRQVELRGEVETTNTRLGTANTKLGAANTNLELALKNETALKTRLQTALDNETTANTNLQTALREAKAVAWQRLYLSLIVRADRWLSRGNHTEAAWIIQSIPRDQRGWEAHYLARKSSGTPLTLYGHQGDVSSVAFSPDGTRIVSGSEDQSLKVWDAQTGEELLTLSGHQDGVSSVAFSPDGTRIVSGSRDGTLKVWDAHKGDELLTLVGQEGGVFSVAYSPDGTRIVSGGSWWDNTIKVWDAYKGDELLTLDGQEGGVNCVAFSPDGTRIVSGSGDLDVPGEINIWDARTGAELLTLKGHQYGVSSLAYSRNGLRIASGSLGGAVKVWDAQTGEELLTLDNRVTGKVYDVGPSNVAFSPDGRRIVSSSEDKTLTLWDAENGSELLTLKGDQGRVNSVAFSPDGTRIVSGSEDNTIKVWDAKIGTELLTLRGHQRSVKSVAYSPDGTRIVNGSEDKNLKVWDAQTGEELLTLRGHQGPVKSVAYSPEGTRIVSGSEDGTLKIWDAHNGAELLTLKGHQGSVYSVAYNPDGTRVASGSEDGTLKVWDAQSGEELLTLECQICVTSVAYSPDGTRIVSGFRAGTLTVWDAQSGDALHMLRGHQGSVDGVAYSPDGTQIVSGNTDQTIKVWDANTGAELLTLDGHQEFVRTVAYSPDGRRIVSGCGDGTVKIWDAQSGDELLTLEGHQGEVFSVAFSPDGTRIVSGSEDNTIKVWDARNGELVSTEPWSEHRFQELSDLTKTEHDPLRVLRSGAAILLIRKNPDYDPWTEDAARREYWVPIWHAEDVEKAEQAEDWFAARFHLRWLVRHKPGDPALEARLQKVEAAWQEQRAKMTLSTPVEAARP